MISHPAQYLFTKEHIFDQKAALNFKMTELQHDNLTRKADRQKDKNTICPALPLGQLYAF